MHKLYDAEKLITEAILRAKTVDNFDIFTPIRRMPIAVDHAEPGADETVEYLFYWHDEYTKLHSELIDRNWFLVAPGIRQNLVTGDRSIEPMPSRPYVPFIPPTKRQVWRIQLYRANWYAVDYPVYALYNMFGTIKQIGSLDVCMDYVGIESN